MADLKEQAQTLFAYHWHTTRQLFEQVRRLVDADSYYAPVSSAYRSIHELFVHLLSTDQAWRQALESGTQPPRLPAETFPTFQSVEAGFVAEQAAWQALFDRLGEDELAGTITLTTVRGVTFDMQYWRILQHLILHGMQHHTEIAHALTSYGYSPGDIDFIFFS